MTLVFSDNLSHYQKTVTSNLYESDTCQELNSQPVTVLSYNCDDDDNYEINIDFNSNTYGIFTDLKKYCYVKCHNDNICDKINQTILTKKLHTSFFQIINTITNLKINNEYEPELYPDKYHL